MKFTFSSLGSNLIRHIFPKLYTANKLKELRNKLRFTIGDQYEAYEFNLKSQGTKTINSINFEIYLYDKTDFESLFDIPISRGILLLFNADILSCIYYRFNGNHFNNLLNQLNSYLPIHNKMKIDPFKPQRATCKLESHIILELLVKTNGDTGLSMTITSIT